jgi:methylglutaconyl-CoA hydratase
MKYLKIEEKNNFKIISLNRPEVKNAFHPEMIAEITEVFLNLNAEKNIKVVLLKGEGNIFCAGADLNWMKEMVNYTFEQNILDSEKLWDMFEAIKNCEIPVIVKATGSVFGGALGILACADYVYATENTKFCFSEVRLGLAPAVISSFIMRKCSDSFVRPLMLSAEIFDTATAEAIGLIQRRFHSDMADLAILENFEDNGTDAMRATKKLLNQISGTTWAEQKKLTTTVISERRTSAEAQGRLNKFLDKK